MEWWETTGGVDGLSSLGRGGGPRCHPRVALASADGRWRRAPPPSASSSSASQRPSFSSHLSSGSPFPSSSVEGGLAFDLLRCALLCRRRLGPLHCRPRGRVPSPAIRAAVIHLRPPLTVVVAYWRFTSKHSSAEYDAWLQHFLANCEAPMVLFTSASQYPTLAALRYGRLFEGASPEAFAPSTANAVEEVHLPLRPSRSLRRHFLTHWVLDFASPLDIPLMAQLRPAFESQLATDPERVRHSALLYATWSAKPWLVNHSAALNVFGSRYFAWMDAGQFRRLSRPLHRLPSAAQLAAAFEEAELPSSPPFPPHRAALHPHPSSAPVASRHHKALLVAVHPYTRDFCRPLDPSSSHPPHLLLDQHAGSVAATYTTPVPPLC